jgi:hypothetical protein
MNLSRGVADAVSHQRPRAQRAHGLRAARCCRPLPRPGARSRLRRGRERVPRRGQARCATGVPPATARISRPRRRAADPGERPGSPAGSPVPETGGRADTAVFVRPAAPARRQTRAGAQTHASGCITTTEVSRVCPARHDPVRRQMSIRPSDDGHLCILHDVRDGRSLSGHHLDDCLALWTRAGRKIRLCRRCPPAWFPIAIMICYA